MARPIIVLPVPGGPNSKIPLGGARIPVKMSGLSIGQTIISLISFFAKSKPAISYHFTDFVVYKISHSMISTSFFSSPLYKGLEHFSSSSF
jgi:hypothetical protein